MVRVVRIGYVVRPVGMVGVAQLVERRVVVADVAGSSPVTHPVGVHVIYVTPGQVPDSAQLRGIRGLSR